MHQLASQGPAEDPLLVCLTLVARHHGRPVSPESLAAGLPLKGPRLSLDLLDPAAERAGLHARVARRSLDQIRDYALPCILLLAEGECCVALARNAEGWEVLLPERAGGAALLSPEDLAGRHTGFVVLAGPRPAPAGDERTPPRGSWYWGTLARFWREYASVAAAATLLNLLCLAVPLFTMNVYDRVVPNNALDSLWVLAIGASVAVVFEFTLRSLRGLLVDHAGRNADILVGARIFQHVLALPMASRPSSTGAFASHLREFEGLRDFFASATLSAMIDLPFVLLFLAVVAWVGGPLVTVPAVAVPLIIGLGYVIQMPMERMTRLSQRDGARRHGLLVEALSGLEAVKALGAEGRMLRRWEEHSGAVARAGLWSRTLSALAVNAAMAIQSAVTIAMMVWGVHLIGKAELSSGGLIASTMLLGRIMAPLAQIATLLSRMQQAVTAFRTLDAIMRLPSEHHAEPRLRRPDLAGGIELRDVVFQYPDRAQQALDGVSLRIEPGERVALVGGIGSGKSSVARLVLGLYQPAQGQVLIDGIAQSQLAPADIRRCFGYVPQDLSLFAGSIRDNITLAAPWAEDDSILRAVQASGVEDFARRHPLGLDMPVGERGEGLSGGQRQAIAIARALLAAPRALILDEPTSAMDQATEERLKQRLARLLPGRTLLLITHRPSLLSLVDRIVVMEAGKVYADGPRDQVLAQLNQAHAQSSARVVQL